MKKTATVLILVLSIAGASAAEHTLDVYFDDFDWTLVAPGDVVKVCGLHDGHNLKDRTLNIGASGAPGNPITVTYDCPSNPPTHISAVKVTRTWGGGWTLLAPYETFSIPYSGDTTSQLLDHKLRKIRRRVVAPDETWKPGEYYNDTAAKILYYKPFDEVEHVYARQGSGIRIENQSHLEIISPNIQGVGTSGIHLINADFITIIDPTIKFFSYAAIEIRKDSDDVSILGDIDITECANGIYATSGTEVENNDRLVIQGNRDHNIYNLNLDGYYPTPDNHGVGIQGGAGGRIENLHIDGSAGSCITHYVFDNQTIKDTLIRDVFCQNTAKGIESGGHTVGHLYDGNTNNIVINNTFQNVGLYCVGTRAQVPAGTFSWMYANNMFDGCDLAVRYDDRPDGNTGFLLYNNSFLNFRTQFEHISNGEATYVERQGNRWHEK